MMSNQQILDHATYFLYDRHQRHKGLLVSGWGKGDDPDNRCILGSLYTGKCQDNEIHSYVQDILGFRATENKLCQELMHFNDMTAMAQEEGFLRGEVPWTSIEHTLKALADRFKLEYTSPIETINKLNKLRQTIKQAVQPGNQVEEIK